MKRQHWFLLCLALAMLVLVLSGCTSRQEAKVRVSSKTDKAFVLSPEAFPDSHFVLMDVTCLVKIKVGEEEYTVTQQEELTSGEVKIVKLEDIFDIEEAKIIDVEIQDAKIVSNITNTIGRTMIEVIIILNVLVMGVVMLWAYLQICKAR